MAIRIYTEIMAYGWYNFASWSKFYSHQHHLAFCFTINWFVLRLHSSLPFKSWNLKPKINRQRWLVRRCDRLASAVPVFFSATTSSVYGESSRSHNLLWMQVLFNCYCILIHYLIVHCKKNCLSFNFLQNKIAGVRQAFPHRLNSITMLLKWRCFFFCYFISIYIVIKKQKQNKSTVFIFQENYLSI